MVGEIKTLEERKNKLLALGKKQGFVTYEQLADELKGFVNIIKPTGMTSSDVVCKVKKILHMKKVGHLGTLDPAASGVLPVAVGRATKFFDYFLTNSTPNVPGPQ